MYSVRRHKVDDYHGHYHVWLWAAACWFIMATDAAASLHQGLQQVMISLTGTRIAGDGSIWWVVPALLLVGSIGSRLLIDMWSSRLSSAALILAAIAYLTALAAFFHGIVLQSEVAQLLLVQAPCSVDTCCWPCRWGCTPGMSCLMPRGFAQAAVKKKGREEGWRRRPLKKNRQTRPRRAMWRRKIPRQAAEAMRPIRTTARKNQRRGIRRHVGGRRPAARLFAARLEARDTCGDIGRAAR